MKYIKLYDSNFYRGKDPPKPDCDPHKIKINFNLIKDLCDLSLDIIDNNYRLHLWVTIDSNNGRFKNDGVFYEYAFDHSQDFGSYYKYFNIKKIYKDLNGVNVYYKYIYALKGGNSDNGMGILSKKHNSDQASEIESIIKEMYPGENVDMFDN